MASFRSETVAVGWAAAVAVTIGAVFDVGGLHQVAGTVATYALLRGAEAISVFLGDLVVARAGGSQ